jgi:hypothetical protein
MSIQFGLKTWCDKKQSVSNGFYETGAVRDGASDDVDEGERVEV